MNRISQLRQDIQKHGVYVIDLDEYDELQREWITRAKIDFNGDYIPREKIIEVIYQLKNTTVGGVTSGIMTAKMECLRHAVNLLEALVGGKITNE